MHLHVLILPFLSMSVLLQKNSFSFIDHGDFINKLYKAVLESNIVTSYKFSEELFSIKNDSKTSKTKTSRKRSRESDKLHEETLAVKQMYEDFLLEFPAELQASMVKTCNTSDVRDLARIKFESTVFDHSGLKGGNNSDIPLKCAVKDEYFLIPANSRFYSGCVKEQCRQLNGSKFDVVVADPPWWNKFIRRLKSANDKLSYSMMYNEDIASIPVQNLLSNTCLVAVWCTNAPSNIDAVKNTIFPQWGVKYVTTWYWLKVTVDLELICQFGVGNKKQPYERLILGSVGEVNVPKDHLMVSVPSALHSHKPPLLDLLAPYIKTKTPQVLELFARYLLPNTTSVGYEPLKWQHISLYQQVNREEDKDNSEEYTVNREEDRDNSEEYTVNREEDRDNREEDKVTCQKSKDIIEENKDR